MDETIKKYLDADFSVIPIVDTVWKKPYLSTWACFQEVKATYEQAENWKLPIACIGGEVSRGLVCLDFDDKASKFEPWKKIILEKKPILLDVLTREKTPSGGYHLIFRTSAEIRNMKLAQRTALIGEIDKHGKPVIIKNKETGEDEPGIVDMIETRGEGGYFCTHPSDGYVLEQGDILNPVFLMEDDVEIILAAARSFNEIVDKDIRHEIPKELKTAISSTGKSPFDDFDSRETPVEILLSHGWSIFRENENKIMFCRPDKKRSTAATWNHIPNRFYVFTTSTTFKAGSIYKPSAVFAILEHGGDFVAAAKSLYQKGYGERASVRQQVDVDTVPRTVIYKMSDFKDDIYAQIGKGYEEGLKVGLEQFDKLMRFDRGYLTVITGIPTHGKSEVLDFVLVLLAKKHEWKTMFFSPENYPPRRHFNKLAVKYLGKLRQNMTRPDYESAFGFIDKHFRFVNVIEDDLSLNVIMDECLKLKNNWNLDCLVIDPWNELELSRPSGIPETEYIGICLKLLRKFAKKNNICVIVVAHTTKVQKIKDTEIFQVPTMYDISGSANWYNKSEFGIVVYRDFDNNISEVYMKRLKFPEFGSYGMVKLKYEIDKGTYSEEKEKENEKHYQN